jgi:hypothetical protein
MGAYLALPGEVFTGTVGEFLIKADEDGHRFTGREIIELIIFAQRRTSMAVLDRTVVMKKVEADQNNEDLEDQEIISIRWDQERDVKVVVEDICDHAKTLGIYLAEAAYAIARDYK